MNPLDSYTEDRKRYWERWGALKTERSSWFPHWQEISEFLTPRTGRFFITDRNRGQKRNTRIYDNTATRSYRVLSAGLMAGMTSPARPWFRLATTDEDLMDSANVKIWLEEVANTMRDIFAKGNTYRAMHSVYEELGAFGSGADIITPDFNDVIRHYPLTIGQYAISTDDRDEVDTLYREFELTIAQVVGKFVVQPDKSMDWSVTTPTIKTLWDRGSYDQWVPVLHAIQPRRNRDQQYQNAKNMPFASCYLEMGQTAENKFLRESGYKRFPALCPRWLVSGGDIYGSDCPGMEGLGDIKQLQHAQFRKSQGIDYQVKPSLQVPPGTKGMEINTLPGEVSTVDSNGMNSGIRAAWQPNLNLQYLLEDIQDVRQRVEKTFYTDLFLMLAQDNGEMTAREVAERHEEKMLMLGPVLERLQNEMLKPLIDITFDRIIETGIAPPIPKELRGMQLNVEFVSVLAQAQRAVGTTSIDRLLGTVLSIAQVDPSIVDKIDLDKTVDKYSDALGVDPNLIRPDDDVKAIRDARAKVQAQQHAAEVAPAAAQTAKTLSQANTGGKNALTDLLTQFSGYSIPTGGAGA